MEDKCGHFAGAIEHRKSEVNFEADIAKTNVPVMATDFRLLVVACAALLAASPAIAQGGGGFGLSVPQNIGPRYPGDEERDVGGCVWRKQWIVDDRGRRMLRRVRVCY